MRNEWAITYREPNGEEHSLYVSCTDLVRKNSNTVTADGVRIELDQSWTIVGIEIVEPATDV